MVEDLEGLYGEHPAQEEDDSSGGCGCFTILAVGGGGALGALVMFLFVSVLTGGAPPAQACETSDGGYTFANSQPSEAALSDIPENYLNLYRKAGEEYGLDWTIIAGIGSIESDHGRLEPGCEKGPPNHTGEIAQGPTQFLPSTWDLVGVDGNGDGEKNPCDPADAIPATANYLSQSGAPDDYHRAITTYNQSEQYYRDVMAKAEEYRQAAGGGGGTTDRIASSGASLISFLSPKPAQAQETTAPAGGDAVFPLPEEYADDYSNDWGDPRPQKGPGGTHEGTDIMAPRGTTLRSMVSGEVVENVEADSEGYTKVGGYTVMIEAAESVGPIEEGDHIYYGHMQGPPSVSVGEKVEAGQPVGKIGSTGEGPKVTRDQMPPHVHVGWYDPTGRRAQTASGAMNPYQLLNWLKENGGSVSGGEGTSGATDSGAGQVACPDSEAGTGKDSLDTSTLGGPQKGVELVKAAKKYMGTPYVLGGQNPQDCNANEIDCTCLIYLSARDIELPGWQQIPDGPASYANVGKPVDPSDIQAGDIFYRDGGPPYYGHAGIYTGNGHQIIHATPPETMTGEMPPSEVDGIRRIVDGP